MDKLFDLCWEIGSRAEKMEGLASVMCDLTDCLSTQYKGQKQLSALIYVLRDEVAALREDVERASECALQAQSKAK